MTNQDDRIELRRAELIEVYNGVGLPYSRNDRELKEYVKPNVSTEEFQITLRLTVRMTDEEFKGIETKNSKAQEQARRAIKEKKLLKKPVREFLNDHPELGYTELPTCYTEGISIFLTTSLNPYLRFYNDEVGKECDGLVERVSGIFQQYGSQPAEKQSHTTKR